MNTHRPTPDHDPADVAGIAPAVGMAERLSPGIGTADAATALLHRADETADSMRPAQVAQVVPIAPRRRRTRRALAGLAVASVLGIAAAGVTVVLPADSPAGPSAAVAAEIEKLALRAGSTPTDKIGKGDLLHTVDISHQDGRNSPDSWTTRRESWVAPDGSSWARQQEESDRVHVWHFPATGEPSLNAPTPAFLASLPTDRDELRDYLDEHVQGSSSHDEAIFVAVGDLLRPGYGSPKLRAAALGVLTTLPGVDIRDSIALPSGRIGTGLLWKRPTGDGPHSVSTLIIDPETSRVLGETSATSKDASWKALSYWTERTRSTVVGSVPATVRDEAITQK